MHCPECKVGTIIEAPNVSEYANEPVCNYCGLTFPSQVIEVGCPNCRKWMPCTAKVEMWKGQDYVTILCYDCEECGQSYENSGDGQGLTTQQSF